MSFHIPKDEDTVVRKLEEESPALKTPRILPG